jgi:phosphate transport system permease protein
MDLLFTPGENASTEELFPDTPRRPVPSRTTGDRVFRGLATAAASVALVIVSLTFIFMVAGSYKAMSKSGYVNFFTKSVWSPTTSQFGVLGLLVGTAIIATIALVIAVPLALGMALFINEYAPARVRRPLTSVIDLLAALPSLLFGLWGFFALSHHITPVSKFLATHLSVLPFFRPSNPDVVRDVSNLTQSSFWAGVVVALMILPIVTAVSREVMSQAPRDQCEAALALGGTRWGMIRAVILPFGRSGIVGAILLGFGRALGETIAVVFMISLSIDSNGHILERGAGSIASFIAIKFGEAATVERSALVGAGMALFLVTFVVNIFARRIVNSARSVS